MRKETLTEATENQENFATEIFREFKKQHRFTIICLTALLALFILLHYKDEYEWRKLLNSCNFATQDGGGFNNINSGHQGDLLNEPESKNKKE